MARAYGISLIDLLKPAPIKGYFYWRLREHTGVLVRITRELLVLELGLDDVLALEEEAKETESANKQGFIITYDDVN